MTGPRATGPAASGASGASEPPDEARLRAELGSDRRHERFLVRAALVAVVLVALMITARTVWA